MKGYPAKNMFCRRHTLHTAPFRTIRHSRDNFFKRDILDKGCFAVDAHLIQPVKNVHLYDDILLRMPGWCPYWKRRPQLGYFQTRYRQIDTFQMRYSDGEAPAHQVEDFFPFDPYVSPAFPTGRIVSSLRTDCFVNAVGEVTLLTLGVFYCRFRS